MKYKLGAVIPTVQFGNLQPEIELEGEDLDVLHAEAMAHIGRVWRENGSAPLTVNKAGGREILTFTGEKILYDDEAHRYTDLEGNELLSGSKYAERFGKKFDKGVMIPKTATSWGVDEKDLGDLWEMNAKISTEYGCSIHTALEVYHRFHVLGAKVQAAKNLPYNYALPKNAHIRKAVLAFVEAFGTDALPEIFVSDLKNKRVGQIDRLAVLDADNKVARVQDYKSNNDMDADKMTKYQNQLSFYAQILMAHDWTIEGLDIFHLTEKGWEKTELQVLPVIT